MDGRSTPENPDRESLFTRTARFFSPVFRWRRRDPSTPVLCPYCGYDLRPMPKACPICGALVANGRISRGQAPDPLVAQLRIAIPPRPQEGHEADASQPAATSDNKGD